jgi:uncharacterized membrane protein
MKTWPSAEDLLRADVALPGAYLLFLLAALLAFRIPETRQYLTPTFPHPGLLSLGIALLSLLSLVLAIRWGRGKRPFSAAPGILAFLPFLVLFELTHTFSWPLWAPLGMALGYPLLLWWISGRLGEVQRLIPLLFAFALLSAAAILLRGTPLLDPLARAGTAVTPERALFHGFAVLTAALLVAYRSRRLALSLISFLLLLAVLSGFKSDALSVLLAGTITGVLLGKIRWREVLSAGIAAVLLLTLLSSQIATTAYGQWKIPPLLYPIYRAGFTFSVFDRIVPLAFPFGHLHGAASLSTTQEVMSTSVLGYEAPHIITSTLLGPGMLDFGVPGALLTAASVGLCLGVMEGLGKGKIQICLYAVALTHTLILIEVGLQLTSILFLLSLLYLSLRAGQEGER